MKEIIIHTTIAIMTTEIDKCKTYIYDKRFLAQKIVPEKNGVTSMQRLEV